MLRPVLVVALAVCSVACRDLSVVAPGNTGPVVRFAAPDAAQPLPVIPFVALEVEDANGVRSATLSCSAGTLRTWTAPPFEGQVDLTPCLAGSARDAGSSLSSMTLIAEAVDALGQPGDPVRLTVTVDWSLPALRLLIAPSLPPRSRVEFELTSDLPLAAPPIVHIDGAKALIFADGDSRRRFKGELTTPGLGIDQYTGAAEPPIEVLEEIERPLPIDVQGMSDKGNTTHLRSSVRLSRIAWIRSVPGGLAVPLAGSFDRGYLRPSPTPAGLALHQPVEQTGLIWMPGYLLHGDGEYGSPNPDLLGSSLYVARAIDAQGRTLLQPFSLDGGMYRLGFRGQSLESVPGFTNSLSSLRQLLRVWPAADDLCQELPAPSCTYVIECLRPDAGVARYPVSNTQAERVENSEVILRSADALLALPDRTDKQQCCLPSGGCGPRGYFFGTPGSVSSRQLPPEMTVRRALPVGDGTFVLSMQPDGGSRASLMRLTTGADAGHYAELADAGVTAENVLAALPDGTLLISRRPLPLTHTLLELWAPNGTRPATARLPGLWTYAPGAEPQLPHNVVIDPGNGDITLLMRTGNAVSAVYVVVALDSRLRLQWLYRYPDTLATESSTPLMLVGGRDTLVYLVDPDGQRVVALKR